MRIIVEGDLTRLTDRRMFECPMCGCMFEASSREYVPDYNGNEVDYRAICPCCGKAVHHGILIGGDAPCSR